MLFYNPGMTTIEHINSWSLRAKCRGLEDDAIFFPTGAKDVAAGKRFCRGCPVLDLCKTYAIANDTIGIWGGTSHLERRKIDQYTKDLVRQLYYVHGLIENLNQAWITELEECQEQMPGERLPIVLMVP